MASVDDLLMSDSSDDEKVTVVTVISEKKERQSPQPPSYAEEFEVEVPDYSNLLDPPGPPVVGPGGDKVDRSQCSLCGQVVERSRLAGHEAVSHPAACPDCNRSFILAKSLERHQRKAHPVQTREIKRETWQTRKIVPHVPQKNISITKTKEVEERLADGGEIQVLNIDRTDKRVSTIRTYEEQMKPTGPFICEFCRQEFRSWGVLTRHFTSPHIFQCDYCELNFNEKLVLENHVNQSHGSYLVGHIDSTKAECTNIGFR